MGYIELSNEYDINVTFVWGGVLIGVKRGDPYLYYITPGVSGVIFYTFTLFAS